MVAHTVSTPEELEEARVRFMTMFCESKADWDESNRGVSPEAVRSLRPEFADVATTDVTVNGPTGGAPARWYEPQVSPRGMFVWIHGGAFVHGDLDMPEAHWVSLAVAAEGFSVLSLDYRKSLDGTSFPSPAEDVLAGWNLAVQQHKKRGIVGPIHLGGASAGAALAAALTVRLRDEQESMPTSLFLAYPVVHPELPELNAEIAEAVAGIPSAAFNAQVIGGMNLQFAGSVENLQNPLAFAGIADLGGLPRTFLLNSERDVLRASGELFAEQLADANVRVECMFEPGSLHGQLNDPRLPDGQRSLRRLLHWLDVTPASTSDGR